MHCLRKITLWSLGAALACAAAQADDYRFELNLAGEHASFDFDDAADLDAVGVGGTYYLAPVPTDGLPLAEAAFLNRSSFIDAFAVRSELGDEKIDVFGANFGYYVPGTMFYGRIGVTYADDFGGDQTNVNGTFGITPLKGLRVTTDIDEDGWDPNVTARHVGRIADRNWYAASVSVTDPDEGDVDVGLDFDFFFDPTFSVGAGFSSGSDSIAVRAEKFFRTRFAVGAHAYTGDDGDGFGAHFTWRF